MFGVRVRVTTPTFVPLFAPNPRHQTTSTVVAAAATPKEISGLGQAVLTALNSSPPKPATKNKPVSNPNPNPNPKAELSGSDILRALQKASANKARVSTNAKNRPKSHGSGGPLKMDDVKKVVDYDKVRPIVVKSDWSTRLDDLDKRLQEFSSL